MTEEQLQEARIKQQAKQERMYFLEAMGEVRSYYPGEDLTFIRDLETARLAWRFGEKGLTFSKMVECVEKDAELKGEGWDVFTRIYYWRNWVLTAPSHMFRPDFDRTKAS